jgi:hypothetical protein
VGSGDDGPMAAAAVWRSIAPAKAQNRPRLQQMLSFLPVAS